MAASDDFHCNGCGACCTNLGATHAVLVLRSDLRRLAGFIGLDVEQTRDRYLERNRPFSEALGRPVLSLRADAGRCVFLTADNRCSVHAAKPRQCREGPDAFMAASMTDYPCMQDRPIADTRGTDREFFVTLLTEED